jgi:transposase-like protein
MTLKTVSRNSRRSRVERERLMAEYDAGEVSQRAFCAQCDVAYRSFGDWRKQLRNGLPAEGMRVPAPVELPA